MIQESAPGAAVLRAVGEDDWRGEPRILVLGPLTVRDPCGGSSISVSQPLHRQVLATLALCAETPCPRAWLASAIWDRCPPDHPAGAVRTIIYRLRRALDPTSVRIEVAGDDGYTLFAGPGGVDVSSFRSLAQAGRVAWYQGEARRAADLLAAAESLWREPPLADLPSTPALADARAQLAREHQDVQDLAMDARLALGECAAAVPVLRARLDGDPLREHTWAQLMLALSQCGSPADALAAFSEAQAALRYHNGAGPGPELTEIRRRIAAGAALS